MNQTTKLLLAFIASASLGLGAVACSGDDTSGTTPTPAKDAGPGADTGPTPGTDSGADTSAPPVDAGSDAPVVLPTGMIDRMGRPAINTALNYGDDTAKDSYNHTDTFASPFPTTWDSNFDKNLKTFDGLDGTFDWGAPDAGTHPLAGPLKTDVLFVDTGILCGTVANNFCEGGYLEIENQLLLAGPAHTTCGGRTPAEDVIDKTLSLLVLKKLSGVSDGVSAATKAPTHTFPYLAAPN